MRITRITPQKKSRGRKNIFADGQFALGLSDETLLRAGLRTGDEITADAINSLIRQDERSHARRIALQFLSHRPRTAKELRDKLREKEFSDTDIAETVADLTRAGLINDLEFARMFIRDTLSVRPTGPNLLRRKLLLHGVEKAVVDETLKEAFADVDDTAAATEAGRKFLKRSPPKPGLSENIKVRNRLVSFLVRRGFQWNTIEPVVKHLLKEHD